MVNRIYNFIKSGINNKSRTVKWSESKETKKNIGDALNPYLFEKIFKKEPINIKNSINTGIFPVYSFIGSVLDNSAVKNLHILGSGFRNEKSIMLIKPKKVYACRGPLTREKLIKTGIVVPEVYGDPAILLPKYFNIEAKKSYKMGIIPHYVDKDFAIVRNYINKPEVKFIDVFAPMENFVSDIKSCDFTISSSLHGVIISQAYGIPSVWVKFSNNIGGGNFKFNDYYLSLGIEVLPVEIFNRELTIEELKMRAILPDLSELTANLAKTFENCNI